MRNFFFFFLLVLLSTTLTLIAATATSSSSSLCVPEQRSLLIDLKKGFSFYQDRLGSWGAAVTDCCKWEGVTCDNESGLVIKLDLSELRISGNITSSSALFNLTSLHSLNLAGNNFYGQIPTEIEKLSNLTYLNLDDNNFYGQIPKEVLKLTNLVSLDLSFNDYGQLELKNPNFETLLKNLTNLRELRLDGVNISAVGYEWSSLLAKWSPQLQVLSLRYCSLSNITSSSALFNLTSLHSLSLAGNAFYGQIPTEIEKLSNLTYLDLAYNNFYGQIPKEVLKLTSLVSLDLSSYNSDDQLELKNPNFETLLKNLTNLRELSLGGIDISAVGYEWSSLLAKWTPQLQVLSLGYCSLTGPLHWHSSSLSKLHNLSLLNLDFNPFDSSVPHSFTNFSSLTVLSLSFCGLGGFFPPELFLLQNLTQLDLSSNPGLSGYLTDFAVGSKLEFLDLGGTNFSGHLPNSIEKLKFLTTLFLYNCRFSGEIPMSLYQLSGLEGLDLSSNNFNGTLEIDRFKQLRNLQALDLSYNQLNVVQTEDDDYDDNPLPLPNFAELGLVSCNLSTVPSFLRYAKYLRNLDISDNKISGKIPNWLWILNYPSSLYATFNLSHNLFTSVEFPIFDNNASYYISFIDLSSNMLQGSIPLPPTFTYILDYSNNNFSSSIPSNFSSYLDKTSFLSLANSSLIGHIPPSICNLPYLNILDLSNNNLKGPIPSCLLESSSLGVLNLQGNQLQGTIPHDISKECALQTLKLGMNQIKGHIPRSLANCHALEVLDVGNNHINDSFPFWLGGIHTLRVLVLRSNHFYGPITPSLGNHQRNQSFFMLQLFDISSNHFSGSLPDDCFKNLKAMMNISSENRSLIGYQLLIHSSSEYYQDSMIVTIKDQDMTIVRALSILTLMDFSNNDFEGNIPDVIGELSSLNVLNFSHNALRDKIPTSIGNLKLMESLDLSKNHLSGEIPQTLCNLTFLAVLNLSNNDLVGVIPQGNQLSTFSNSSFDGNEGLCGPPLSKQCYKRAPTNTSLIPYSSTSKTSSYVLGLALFIGIGFGVGMAIVLVLQNMKWEFCKMQNAN